LVKDVKEQEDKIKRLNALESQLKEVVLGLDKDIAGHKKEVRTHCLSYKMMLIRKRGF